MKGRWIFHFLICLCCGNLSTQLLLGSPSQPYRGDIREDDLRVAEARALLIAGKDIPRDGLRLRYAGKRGDYLEFYDLEGQSIYYRYRRDRFDQPAEQRVKTLIRGQAYRVEGRFQGLLYEGTFFLKEKTRAEVFSKLLANKNTYLVFIYLSASPLRIKQLLL